MISWRSGSFEENICLSILLQLAYGQMIWEMMLPFLEKPIFIIDWETTGLKSTRQGKSSCSKIRVFPTCAIDQKAQECHGLDLGFLAQVGAPKWGEVSDKIKDWVKTLSGSEEPIFVAHNATFDFTDTNIYQAENWTCSMNLAKKKGLPAKLEDLANALKIRNPRPHSAFGDVLTTALALPTLLSA